MDCAQGIDSWPVSSVYSANLPSIVLDLKNLWTAVTVISLDDEPMLSTFEPGDP